MQNLSVEQVVEALLQQRLSTLEFYFERHPSLAEDRKRLQQTIISKIINNKTFAQDRRVYILGGAPANGKSTFLKSAFCKPPSGALRIDPDKVKVLLPEYGILLQRKDPLAAALVHEESSVVAKALRQTAVQRGLNLILDGVANDTVERRQKEYDYFKANRYSVTMDYVSLDTKKSLQLARRRAEETGREVPATFVKAMNAAIAELVPQLIEKECFDELRLWDTNREEEPRLVLAHKNGKLELYESALFERFKQKAHE